MKIKKDDIRNWVLIVFILFPITVQAGNKKIVFSDPTNKIVVTKSNPQFNIILQSNPTTGYSWTLLKYDTKLLSPIQHKFYPQAQKKLLGAPGHEIWSFKVNQKHFSFPQTITNINFVYARPWEKQPDNNITTFQVEIMHAN